MIRHEQGKSRYQSIIAIHYFFLFVFAITSPITVVTSYFYLRKSILVIYSDFPNYHLNRDDSSNENHICCHWQMSDLKVMKLYVRELLCRYDQLKQVVGFFFLFSSSSTRLIKGHFIIFKG